MKTKNFATAAAAAMALAAVSPAVAQQSAPLRPAYQEPATGVYVPPAKRMAKEDAFIAQLEPRGGRGTPKKPDGRPDLTGFYNGGWPSPTIEDYGRRCNSCSEADQTKTQRGSHYYKPFYKPEYWTKVEALDHSMVDTDPAFGCEPEGVPRMGIPQKILQADNEIWLYDGGEVRIIPIDGRPFEDEAYDLATVNGVSVGHFEGDVLVIESIGFGDSTWLAWEGQFHTNQMKVTERLWRDGDLLFYNFTVDDPDIFIRPWNSATQFARLGANQKAVPGEPLPCLIKGIDTYMDKFQRG